MLSVEEGIVDTTTDEGRKRLEELEAGNSRETETEKIEEPGE
jgi:cell division cycle protein 37